MPRFLPPTYRIHSLSMCRGVWRDRHCHPINGALQWQPCPRRLRFVDLDFECSTVCPILPGLMGIWQKRLGSWARWWNIEIKVNPTTVYEDMCHPVQWQPSHPLSVLLRAPPPLIYLCLRLHRLRRLRHQCIVKSSAQSAFSSPSMRARERLWGLPYIMSAKFSDLCTPSPLVTYIIHATLILSLLFWGPPPPPTVDVIYGSPLSILPYACHRSLPSHPSSSSHYSLLVIPQCCLSLFHSLMGLPGGRTECHTGKEITGQMGCTG